MKILHHRISFVSNVAGTAVVHAEFFINGDIGIRRAMGNDLANIDGQVVAFDVAGPVEVDVCGGGGSIDVHVRAAALLQLELAGMDTPFEIAGAREADCKVISLDAAVYGDVAGARSAELVDRLERYKCLQMLVIPSPVPMKPIFVDVNAQNAIIDSGHDPVPEGGIGGADGNTFFVSLLNDQVYGTADADTMKRTHGPLLYVGGMHEEVSLLGVGKKSQQEAHYKKAALIHTIVNLM